MKKAIVISLFFLIFFLAAVLLINCFYPYYVHGSVNRYADEVMEEKIEKNNITLCSRITKDETVNSKYISFYIIDNSSQTICFECSDGWRLTDLKYLGFEKDSNNILVISGDTGTYRYVNDGNYWREETVLENQRMFPDSKYYIINNLNDITS